jgi:hypothetical protein
MSHQITYGDPLTGQSMQITVPDDFDSYHPEARSLAKDLAWRTMTNIITDEMMFTLDEQVRRAETERIVAAKKALAEANPAPISDTIRLRAQRWIWDNMPVHRQLGEQLEELLAQLLADFEREVRADQ